MTWDEFKRNFIGGNRWWPNDKDDIRALNALLDKYGTEDFAKAVEIAREKPGRCRTPRYLAAILQNWEGARKEIATIDNALLSEKIGDEELANLIKQLGTILTYPLRIEDVEDLLEKFPLWWVRLAFTKAIERSAGNIKYVQAILYNWELDGAPDAAKATIRQQRYIEGLLKSRGKELADFGFDKTRDMTMQQASNLIPILKELPLKPKEPKVERTSPIDRCVCKNYSELAGGQGIYFIQQKPFGPNGGAIKIGMSNNFAGRLSGLQGGNPDPLALIATIPAERQGRKKQETALHEQFSDLNLFSEWFKPEDPLVSYIESLEGFLGWEQEENIETEA